MDKLSSRTSHDAGTQDMDSSGTAEAMHRDFSDLVEMFERQLAGLPAGDRRAQFHVLKAKAAAERGLLLSRKLLETLRS
jgi:hypothetical protein